MVHCFLKIKMLQNFLKFPCRFRLLVNCFHNWCPLGHREGGQGRQWPQGPWTFRGPSEDPSKWHWQISLWKIEDLFFWDHIKIRRKLWHSRCLIFELTPCPRLALGAPGCPTSQKGVWILQPIRHSVLICKVLHTWHQCSGKVHHWQHTKYATRTS